MPRAVEVLAEAQRRTETVLDRLTERTERGFAEAAADRQRIWEAMREGLAKAAVDRRKIREDIRDLKGDSREQYYRNRATDISGRWLWEGHDATSEVADRLQTALEKGNISDREYAP